MLRRPRLPTFESRGSRRLLGLAMIGLVIAIAIVAVTRPNPLKDTHTVVAVFDSAQGLGKIDQNVRVGGVNAGDMGDVRRVGDDVEIELELEAEIEVHSDATAELRPHTLFEGTDFVDLHLGSPSAPLLGEGEKIEKSRTRVYVSVDTATRVFRKPIREALQDLADVAARTLRGGAIRGLQQTLRAAPELTRDLGPTARALQGPEGTELAGAIRGISQTVDALATRESSLIPLARRANRTFAALAVDGGAPLDATLRALPGALAELRRSGPVLRSLLTELEPAATELRQVLVELGPTLAGFRPIVRTATPIVRRAAPMVRGLRVLLTRAADAAPPLLKLMGILNASGRLLDTSVLPAFHHETRLGIPAYLQMISSFTGGAGAMRPYQTLAQNPNGAGHVMRLALYGDSGALTATGLGLSCGVIAAINPVVAAQLQLAGLCT